MRDAFHEVGSLTPALRATLSRRERERATCFSTSCASLSTHARSGPQQGYRVLKVVVMRPLAVRVRAQHGTETSRVRCGSTNRPIELLHGCHRLQSFCLGQ